MDFNKSFYELSEEEYSDMDIEEWYEKAKAFDILLKIYADPNYCNMQLYGNENTDTYLVLSWAKRCDSIEYEISRNEFNILQENGVKVCNLKKRVNKEQHNEEQNETRNYRRTK